MTVFEQEYHQHGDKQIPGDLEFNPVCGTYRWRCPRCKLGWVTAGSAMDIANDIAFADWESNKS